MSTAKREPKKPRQPPEPRVWKKHCDQMPCGWHLVYQDPQTGETARACYQDGCPQGRHSIVYREW